MSQQLIEELRVVNLCTYYVLPLLKLNKFSFLHSSFLNSYLSTDGTKIIVEIVEPLLLSRNLINHHQFHGVFPSENGTYIVYRVPQRWDNDVRLFMEGKFSQMTQAAKDSIKRFSGLGYNEKCSDGVVRTDGRLLALDKHPILKKMWERELSSTDTRPTGRIRLQEGDELLSIPGKESYIELEGLMQ